MQFDIKGFYGLVKFTLSVDTCSLRRNAEMGLGNRFLPCSAHDT